MLKPARGFTLIELMVGLTIMAFLLMSGVPSISEWVRNSQIRSTAESILTGLHQARGEAVKRNESIRFQLTSTLDNGCAVSTAGTNWVINRTANADTTPAGLCGNDPSDSVAPYILQKTVAANSSSPLAVSATQPVVTFSGLGQQTQSNSPSYAVAQMTIDIKPSAAGTCLTDGGTQRCLRIVVSPAGQARMCDPSLTGSKTTQPMAC